MVRLEKLVYEQIVNSAATNRLRKAGAPRKWHHTNPLEHMTRMIFLNIVMGYNVFENSFIGRFLKPLYENWSNRERAFQRDLFLQQGLVRFLN